jgi:hypothetical protein
MNEGDLILYYPTPERERVPVLVSVEDLTQRETGGVVRILPGDIMEVVAVRPGGWLLARYPRIPGVLLVNAEFCKLWKSAGDKVEEAL